MLLPLEPLPLYLVVNSTELKPDSCFEKINPDYGEGTYFISPQRTALFNIRVLMFEMQPEGTFRRQDREKVHSCLL